MAKSKIDSFRKGLIASIHIAKNDLGLDEETYRQLLFNVTGEVSSAKCKVRQLEAMLAELRKKGWKPKPKKTVINPALVPLRRKISAQCHALGRPESYAAAIILRQSNGAATLKTAGREELRACVAALTRQQERETMRAGGE